MTAYIAKEYQDQVLESVQTYFQACHEFENASTAFYATTERWSHLFEQLKAYL